MRRARSRGTARCKERTTSVGAVSKEIHHIDHCAMTRVDVAHDAAGAVRDPRPGVLLPLPTLPARPARATPRRPRSRPASRPAAGRSPAALPKRAMAPAAARLGCAGCGPGWLAGWPARGAVLLGAGLGVCVCANGSTAGAARRCAVPLCRVCVHVRARRPACTRAEQVGFVGDSQMRRDERRRSGLLAVLLSPAS
jgi:hypothetical protein